MTAPIRYPTADRLRTRMKGDHGTPEARLLRRFVIEVTGCWRWTGAMTTAGYGHFSIRSVYYQAHRLMYILRFGVDVPNGLFPDHLCRNRWCVNPDHLEPVTHVVNIRRGSGTRLTPDAVRAIRAEIARGRGQRALARELRLDHSTISRIVSGHRWADVTDEAAA